MIQDLKFKVQDRYDLVGFENLRGLWWGHMAISDIVST